MTHLDDLKNIKPDINVYYKDHGYIKLPIQVYYPKNFDNNKSYKTVIGIHGGGWCSIKETPVDWDGRWMAPNVKMYAQKGYVGIVFSYRNIECDYTKDVGDILDDCYDAIKYIVDNFDFVDKDNVIIMGDSAGGHLALCLGMELPEGKKCAITPSKIVAYNPVTDCVCDKWKYCADDPEIYSPMHNIKRVEGRILVMHGTEDKAVNIDESRVFTQKMKSVGNDISLIELPGCQHAFILWGFTATEDEVLNATKLTDEYFNL